MSKLSIQSYTDKSIVVIGDTKNYKDSLKSLGGKWNASLTNRETGEKFMGWIFYSSKRNELQNWIDSLGEIGESKQESKQETNRESKQESKQEIKRDSVNKSDTERIQNLEKTVQILLSKLSMLENEITSLKKSTKEINYENVEEFEEEEQVKPRARLLRR